jgi:sortase A
MDDERAAAGVTTGGQAPVRRRGRLRLVGDLLLVVGGLLLAYPFWSGAYAQVQQSRLDAEYQQRSEAFAHTAVATAKPERRSLTPEQEVRRLAARYASGLKPGDPVGRLKIPRIGLSRVVQQGVGGRRSLDPSGDRSLLQSGPVHYGVTPLAGAGEPFAVAGHRTTYGAPFYKLDRLRRGDAIYFETPYARFTYRVAKTTVVEPGDIGVLSDRGYGLVLTTCTPPYSDAQRLIVWALLSRAQPADGGRSR